jgi:hypothetical protein
MTAPGPRVAKRVELHLSQLQFYVDSLTNIERSKLAARYLRKVPAQYRPYLLRKLTIPQLALCQVFSQETYGW